MDAPQRVIERVMSKYDVRPDGCWISRYSVGSHGYAQIAWQVDGKSHVTVAHRVAWQSANGPIPKGMTIDHECHVRTCVNPAHLRLMTNVDNARGGGGLNVGQPQPLGRLCGKGLHELLRYPSGAVACRECQRERSRRKYPRRVEVRRGSR